MSATCTGCWSRFPDGTTWCTSCRSPIAGVRRVPGERDAVIFAPKLPAIVTMVRRLLLLRTLVLVAPFALAAASPARAQQLYGVLTGDWITSRVAGVPQRALLIALLLGALLGWLVMAVIARWYFGRLALLGAIVLSEFTVFVILHADVTLPASQIDLIGSVLVVGALMYSAAKPE